ncbi:MAG TPA: ATP-binding cassette domain-containing protein [Candidatus Dormibacteraeota bacterium]|nr:ATP-binding cassette domain-containing protein [Candidatus Dormibacteraeota bacterium]
MEAVGLALEGVAPADLAGAGASLSVPEGETAVLAGREGAGKSRLVRVLMGLDPGRGRVRIGGEEHDLDRGPLPAGAGLGAILDPPVLQSGLECGANVSFAERAAPRRLRRRAQDVVEALGIEERLLGLLPQHVPLRGRQQVSLAQMLAAGKTAVVWDLARSDLWADLDRARAAFPEVTWLVLVQSARAAVRHGQHAGILERGWVTCYGPRAEVTERLAFGIALRAEE